MPIPQALPSPGLTGTTFSTAVPTPIIAPQLGMLAPTPSPTDTATKPEEVPAQAKPIIQGLAGEIRDRFGAAKNARQTSGVDDQMIRAKRARELEYEPTKLTAIRALMGPQYEPPYVPVIETKCRDLVSWLLATPADENLWELEPEVMAELPKSIEQVVTSQFTTVTAEAILSANPDLINNPKQLDAMLQQAIDEELPNFKDKAMLALKRKSKELVDRLSIKIEGQLDDGKWRVELEKTYYDIATYPAAILKGPIPKKIKIPETVHDPKSGLMFLQIVEKVIDSYKRVSPLNIYSAADSGDINDGDLFEVDSIEPDALYACIGVPGYNEQAIRSVLNKFRTGGLHEWVQFDSERSELEKKGIQFNQGRGTKLDIVWGWCSIQGKLLREFGMASNVIPDMEREYYAWVGLIDSEIVMAQLNPNPLHKKPFYKACFIEDPDKFWNTTLSDILWDHQNLANAIFRACGHNIAYASGPVTEVNKDRLAAGESPDIYPYATKQSTDRQIKEGGPLLRFYQARIIVNELSQFFNFIMQLADTDSGVPHYIAGGQPHQPGAAKNTLGGMQMMRTDAARGLEQIRSNISKGLIAPSVEAQYYQTAQYDGVQTIGGVKVKTRGTEWLAVKDQQTQRIDDTLTKSLNPVDQQIFGMKARQELWREKLRSLHLDPEKILPEDKELIANMTGGQIDGNQPPQQSESGEPGQPGVVPQPPGA